MDANIENVADELEASDDGTVTKQEKSEKTFTQTELDRIVKARLDREKASSQKQIDTLTAELTELRGDITLYEEQLGAVLDVQTSDWDGAFKELFKALPIKEQLAKLKDADFMGKVNRKNVMPITPKPNDTVSEVKQLPFGGKG